MKYYLHLFFSLVLFLLIPDGFTQSFDFNERIDWKGLVKESNDAGGQNEYMYFTDAYTDPATSLPLFTKSFQMASQYDEIQVEMSAQVYAPFSSEEMVFIQNSSYSAQEIEITTSISVKRKIAYGVVNFIPIRYNNMTGYFEKLISFQLHIDVSPAKEMKKQPKREYAENSVLASGDWYKLKVKNSGVYKISYDDLVSYGMDPSAFYPQHIRLYGGVTGMLPESNISGRIDDLKELAIEVVGEDDGVFDQDDYILFFGSDPNTWQNVLGFFTYNINYYETYCYYYLTTSLGVGKRIEKDPAPSATPNQTVSTFNDYTVIEEDKVNLILSGKEWYGDEFGEIITRNYNFNFPNIAVGEPVTIKTEIANRTFINESMNIYINDIYADSVILTSVNPSSTKFAQKKKKTLTYEANSPDINIKMEYVPATSTSRSWLDYIMINLISELDLSLGQLLFRDLSSVQTGNTTQFNISNANGNVRVWDVTDPLTIKKPEHETNLGTASFIVSTDTLREFVAFNETQFYVPEFVEKVENQNLHGEGPFDMVIVSHPLFYEEAKRLAQIHDSIDNLSITTLTVKEIYNEFSAGKQDPTAIRDYMKMLYDRYEGNEPRFLLLFGDGSFDPKDRLENNSNFIPTFQNKESWITSSSYVIDDYFGFLDDTEGNDAIGDLDIGIGRFPVQSLEEAKIVLDKIERYLSKGTPSFGSWRTRTTLIGDDEDGNLHMEQADSLSRFIPDNYNQKKIYLDAYPQISTPAGERYPDVTSEINNQIEEGVLILNYVGHGGKSGWAHERILQTSDIQGWKNKDKLPVFITATCEFSRFDEPELNTGGEMVFLNPDGGGIALFTTTRLAYSQSNFSLNQRLYSRAFTRHDGDMPYLGELILYSKPPGQLTTRNFILMGDPALKMAYPEHEIHTLSINGHDPALENDTLRGLDRITVVGEITDYEGNKLEGFNGVIYPVVYDKPKKFKTFGHDASSYPAEFENQDLIIWQGKDTVVNGSFSFQFMVPMDIGYDFGYGKISYYAHSDYADAFGSVSNIVIGGINESAEQDNKGPEISLFINHESFQSGETIYRDDNQMIAHLYDKNGISLSENGLGHDIVLTIDGDSHNKIILNNDFISNSENYTEGSILYPFDKLEQGRHTLSLKAWDSYNNSSTVSIDFVIQYAELMNFPNPFSNATTFQYYHTGSSGPVDIYLDIYDISGKLVHKVMPSEWKESDGLPLYNYQWNGSNDNGYKLNQGLYIYMVTSINQQSGETNRITQKLLIQ